MFIFTAYIMYSCIICVHLINRVKDICVTFVLCPHFGLRLLMAKMGEGDLM